MKFLHTSDWQIGMKAAHVGSAGERVRQERLAAARRVVDAAKQHAAEYIVVAGDTFENNAIDRLLVQRVGDILAAFHGPVYLIAGNHDPLVPGSVWDHPVWESHDNLHVLREAKPVGLFGVTLYPCPLREKYSTSDPTAWIDARESRDISIGIAHGSVEGVSDGLDFPIARTAATRAGLDYLAVGHWHSHGEIDGDGGMARIAYSGTHETTRFGERDSGNVLLVEIAARGAPPQLTPIRTGGLRWITIDAAAGSIRAAGDLQRLRQQIEAIERPEAALISVALSGVLFPDDQAELARISEIVASRFVYGRIDSDKLRPMPSDDRWLTELPAGVLRDVAAQLCELADPAFAGQRPPGALPEVAAQAMLELYRTVQEVRA